MKKNKRKDGRYFLSIKDTNGKRSILYDFSSNFEVEYFKKSIVYPNEAKLITEYFYDYYEKPLYRFYKIKNKYCVARIYHPHTDIVISSSTRICDYVIVTFAVIILSAIIMALKIFFKYLKIDLFL